MNNYALMKSVAKTEFKFYCTTIYLRENSKQKHSYLNEKITKNWNAFKYLYKQIEQQWNEGYKIERGITSLSEGDPARH